MLGIGQITIAVCTNVKYRLGYANPLLSGEAERGSQMPQVRKLNPEEVKTIENKGKGTRKLTEALYDSILSEYEVGDYGEATLDGDEKRLTVRNRLKAAAGRRNIGLDFKRTQGNTIRFKVIEPGSGNGNGVPAVVPEVVSSKAPAPVKRRGGRPKKVEVPPAPGKRRGARPKKQPA